MEDLNEEKVLELRMYFFVPYNISEIQKGIQAGHAALRYTRMFSVDNPEVWDFVDNHETWIILNGGTTNETRDFDGIPEGSMNKIADSLVDNNIPFSYFTEPDLNNSLTALCFLCDERVFNSEDYPEFIDYLNENHNDNYIKRISEKFEEMLNIGNLEELAAEFPEEYKEWVRNMGGVKNVFLRELIKDKRLA